jgi:sphingoid base N-palmitoyltransferase
MYFIISMAFCLSLTISLLIESKRKDFWPMFTHHIVTLLLFQSVWLCNLPRFGSMMVVIHDIADIFEEASKALIYAKFQKLGEICFGIFAIIWVITRVGMYPRLIFPIIFDFREKTFPCLIIIQSLLMILLVLHVYWTYLIFKVLPKKVKMGIIHGDVRPASSGDDEKKED